jgi:hypothetical protein
MMRTRMKAALLGSTLLALAGPALAQTAPVDDWNLGAVSNTATNTGVVKLEGDINASPTITGGISNFISGTAVGATASNGVRLVTAAGAVPASNVTANSVTLAANNNTGGNVSADTNVLGANIGGGVMNSISGAAIGATASYSMVSLASGTGTAPTTSVAVTGNVDIDATNQETVDYSGNIGVNAPDAPLIVGGTRNSISIAAVGASAGLSFTSVNTDDAVSAESFSIGGNIDILATNQSTGAINGVPASAADIIDATISGGNLNAVSVSAVGASASLSLTTVSDGAAPVSPTVGTTVDFSTGATDTISVAATNSGTVDQFGVIGGATAADGVTIGGGNLNAISMSAVGASASVGFTGVSLGGATGRQDFAVGGIGAFTIAATNSGDVTAGSPGLEIDILDPVITQGNANTISGAAVGASASLSMTSVAEGAGTIPETSVTFGGTGGIVINATNTGAISMDGVIASDTALIAGGNRNAISLAAVGASGGLSYTSVNTTSSASDETFTVAGPVTFNVQNNADGDVRAAISLDGPQIAGGTLNSVSGSAVGASASLSMTTIVNAAAPTSDFLVASGSTITMGATNNETVDLTGTIAGGSTLDPQITGGTLNSISLAAVGASAGMSFTGIFENGGTGTQTFTTGAPTITATNALGADVTTEVEITDATILAGTGNSISGAAVGASASHSTTLIVDGATTTPELTMTYGATTLSSINNADVTLTGTTGSADMTDPTITLGSMNSIALSGVGASSSTSITSVNSGGSASDSTFTYGGITSTATNSGRIEVYANVTNASIAGGTSNAISMSAVGAAASTSFTLVAR